MSTSSLAPANPVVLVTGAGGGIGRAVAESFAAAGSHVILAGRGRDALDETASLVQKQSGHASVLPIDVTDPDSLVAALQRLPRLDVAVNAAGTIASGLLAEMDDEAFRKVFDVNVRGLWLSMRAEVQRMRKDGAGAIINISSNVGARLVRPSMGAYAASKAAVSSLTRTAALEELPNGIRINCICPGPVDTPMSYRAGEDRRARDERLAATNPSGRPASTKEIARAAQWLASSDASYIVGQEIVIDGGASI